MLEKKLFHNKENFILWISYCIFITFLAFRHEPWGDEYHVWRMDYDMNVVEIWKSMRNEGHFCLWHLLVYPFVKIGMDWHALYLVSVPLMLIAAYGIVSSNLSIISKFFVIFSVPFFFNFPVISRCYALIPPIIIYLAYLYKSDSHKLLYCILLGLLANTHAYMEGMVGILWLVFVYYNVIKEEDKELKYKNLLYSLTTIFFVIVAFLQVVSGLIDVANGNFHAGEGKNSINRWFQLLYGKYHIYLFSLKLESVELWCTFFVWVIIAILLFFSIKTTKFRNKSLFLILLCSIGWQFFFAICIYGMNWQRIDLIFFTILFVLLLVNATRSINVTIILLLFWLLNTPCSLGVLRDIKVAYSNDIYIAKEIDEIMPPNAKLYTDNRSSGDLVMRDRVLMKYCGNDTIAFKEQLAIPFESGIDGYYFMSWHPIDLNVEGLKICRIQNGILSETYFYHISKKEKI